MACGDWTGFAGVGTTWTYAGNDDADAQMTSITETVAITSAEGGRWIVEALSETDAPSFHQSRQLTTTYECTANGLEIWTRDEFLEMVSPYGGTTTTTILFDCTEPVLELPLEVPVGATWTQSFACTRTYNAEPEDYVETADCEIRDEGEVTTPAGTWPGREVACTSSPFGILDLWVGQGVGRARDTFTELVDYTPGSG